MKYLKGLVHQRIGLQRNKGGEHGDYVFSKILIVAHVANKLFDTSILHDGADFISNTD